MTCSCMTHCKSLRHPGFASFCRAVTLCQSSFCSREDIAGFYLSTRQPKTPQPEECRRACPWNCVFIHYPRNYRYESIGSLLLSLSLIACQFFRWLRLNSGHWIHWDTKTYIISILWHPRDFWDFANQAKPPFFCSIICFALYSKRENLSVNADVR